MIPTTYHLAAVLFAVGTEEFMEAGRKVGTASNQYLLGLLVVALIIVVLYRERQQNKQHDAQIRANEAAAEKAEKAIQEAQAKHDTMIAQFAKERTDLYERMEKQQELMNVERQQRWSMLIDVVRDNTNAFRGVRETLDNLQRFMQQAPKP